MPITTTARSAPVGVPLEDGFPTKIAFAADPDVSFWEKAVKPPGVDGGDAINITTMHNTSFRTFAARSLKTMSEASSNVTYDPVVYDQIMALINVEGAITVHFPNGDTLDFYGYLKSFVPADMQEGTQPEAAITIVVTNNVPATREEAGPNYKTSAGTD